MQVKEGTNWYGNTREQRFVVISVVDIEDKTWVHYRSKDQEYSCYVESFLQRFTPIVNERNYD